MKKAIRKSAPVLVPANSRVIEFPQPTGASQSEFAIEARLRDLTALVADRTDSGYGVLLSEEIATREAFDELRVKEAALRWIVRVAKHSSGSVRGKLWSDIEDAITGLEKTAELLLHAGIAWPQSAQLNHSDKLAGPGRF
jgi:hypothetical protein